MIRRQVRTRLAICIAFLLGSALGCSIAEGPPYQEPVPIEEPVVLQDIPPPPISGGTMIVTRSSGLAVASDPDRDRVWAVVPRSESLPEGKLVAEIALAPGDEPGRLIEDGAGVIHVALRGGGAVVRIDLAGGAVLDRRPVCGAPRGLAHDEAANTILVTCAGGELVTLPAGGGPEIRRVQLADDLRDVVVDGERVLVSRFRSAEVLVLDADGAVKHRLSPPGTADFEPSVAWRMVPLSGGGAAIIHQLGKRTSLLAGGAVYYGIQASAPPPVLAGISVILPEGASPSPEIHAIVSNSVYALPVDVAISNDRTQLAIVSAAHAWIAEFTRSTGESGVIDWATPGDGNSWPRAMCEHMCQITALAYDAAGNCLVQSREPAILAGVELPAPSRADSGHDLFHDAPGDVLACASCHPEGRDDGRVWLLDEGGPRRTPSLGGGIAATAPFHWNGDLADMNALVDLTYVKRMGAAPPGENHVAALARWMDSVPRMPVVTSAPADSIARGAALFADPAVGCAGCHSGPQRTNGETVDVGTGRAFQVPRLVDLRWRAPYLHDGCAPTLLDRFGPCGGGELHGHTSHLGAGDIGDLVAFLETL